MECEACDCTRAIKLPGKPLLDKLNIPKVDFSDNISFMDMVRMVLNRKRQGQGLKALKNIIKRSNPNLKPVIAGAAISGLFIIFKDYEYFRIKNIPDTEEARRIISELGLVLVDSVETTKSQARHSLAQSDKRSNIV